MAVKPVKQMVAEAKAMIETLSVADVKRALEADEIVLVDIRDVRELDRDGRIPGAFHAPRGMLEFWVDPDSPYFKPPLATERKLVLFCASAWRSALSTRTLREMGLERVAEMEGGFNGWVESGGEVERRA